MEETINLQSIFQILKKHIKEIFIVTLITLILASIITFFVMVPQYNASTQILVNQSQSENEQSSNSDFESSRELISTYNVIITSPAILEPTIQNTNFEGSVEELRSKINVTAEEESQVATITVEDSDPQRASNLANTLGETFENQIPDIMNVDNVSILSKAQVDGNGTPISPKPILNLIIATIIGLTVGIILAFLIELLDKSIKTEEDIANNLNLPILGVVPIMKEAEFNGSSSKMNSNTSMRSKTKSGERKTS